jgi:hypothetical protein
MAGAAMMGGAQSIAGGAQAIMAAFSKANASESGGGSSPGMSDLMSAAGGAGGGSGGDSGGGSALASAMGDSGGGAPSMGGGSNAAMGGGSTGGAPGEVKSGSSRAAAVAAKVGRVAAGTAANLAQGSWDVAKAKASSIKDAAMDRIGETTGGKIAAAIKARDTSEPAFAGDSLSGATDEVSAFVNKTEAGADERGLSSSMSASARSGDASPKSVFD